jgi:hypothetical protein
LSLELAQTGLHFYLVLGTLFSEDDAADQRIELYLWFVLDYRLSLLLAGWVGSVSDDAFELPDVFLLVEEVKYLTVAFIRKGF